MQSTAVQGSRSTPSSRTPVWDLESRSQRRFTPRARPSHAGPIAASFGVAALCSAVVPSAAVETRLFLAIGLGIISVLVGFSALRRRQTRTALVLALVGVTAPAIAIASVVVTTAREPGSVTSSTVQRAMLQPDSNALVPTHDFDSLSADERAASRAFLSGLALQMQTMHGSWAPLPASLAVSNGVLVEGDGILQGTSLGALPPGEKLTYQVSNDGTAFRIAISSSSDPRATIWADRALPITTTG